MPLTLYAPPTVEPVSLAEAKLQCRVDGSEDDALISTYIAAARSQAEHKLRRALITQQWERVLDAFPCGSKAVPLGKPPVQRVEAVRYLDTAGVQQTWPLQNVVLDADLLPGYVLPASGLEWPATVFDSVNAVRIRFTCGYGDTAATVPQDVRAWILMTVAATYRHREAFATGQVAELPNRFTESMLDAHRCWAL